MKLRPASRHQNYRKKASSKFKAFSFHPGKTFPFLRRKKYSFNIMNTLLNRDVTLFYPYHPVCRDS